MKSEDKKLQLLISYSEIKKNWKIFLAFDLIISSIYNGDHGDLSSIRSNWKNKARFINLIILVELLFNNLRGQFNYYRRVNCSSIIFKMFLVPKSTIMLRLLKTTKNLNVLLINRTGKIRKIYWWFVDIKLKYFLNWIYSITYIEA